MSDNFDVGLFHQKFGLDCTLAPNGAGPRNVPDDLLDFRERFMEEELREFREARQAGDCAKMFDALLDLCYVIHGTAHVLGFPWQNGWDEVQRANMSKVRAERAEDSLRGSTWDVVKPPSWQAPDIAGVLLKLGWKTCEAPGAPCIALKEPGSRFCVVHREL